MILRTTPPGKSFKRRYEPRLLAWCVKKGLKVEDARDVAQEVLLRVARNMRTFVYDPGRSFSGWLRTVWQSAWIDFSRVVARSIQASGDPAVMEQLRNLPGDDLAAALEDEIKWDLLQEALARAQTQSSPHDWGMYAAVVLEGKAGADVAALFKTTRAAVWQAKSRVKKAVQKAVTDLESDSKEQDRP